jgi:hypothetical protein
MNTRKVLMLLAVGVLLTGLSGVALADSEGAGYYGGFKGTLDSSVSSKPQMAVEPSYTGEIRGPVETGALPHQSVEPNREGWVNMDVSVQNASPDLRGLPNIQAE